MILKYFTTTENVKATESKNANKLLNQTNFLFLGVSLCATFSPCTQAVLPTKAPDPEFIHFVTPLLGPVSAAAHHKPTRSIPHEDLRSASKPLLLNYTLHPTEVAGISPAHAYLLDQAAAPLRLLPTETLGASTRNKIGNRH